MSKELQAARIAEILVDAGTYVNRWDDEWMQLPDGTSVPAYLSCRRLLAKPKHRAAIEEALIDESYKMFPDGLDLVAGIATAGITLAHGVAAARELPLCYVRSEAKSYGITGSIEGNPPTGTRCLLLDDTLHTGESVVRAQAALLQEKSIEVTGFLAIASLYHGGTEAFSACFQSQAVALTNYEALCMAAQQAGVLDEKQQSQMLAYYNDPRGYSFE